MKVAQNSFCFLCALFAGVIDVQKDLILLGAGLTAGMFNAVAGGGTFISMPVLIYAGLPSVAANASSTVALFPGSLASIYAYRKDFEDFDGVPLKQLVIISIIGGFIGAILLLVTPSSNFDKIIAWLVLLGAMMFIFGKQVAKLLENRFKLNKWILLAVQFVLGIYGGYFGGGAGIMMMAAWSMLYARPYRY